ncbi:GNAT family N-acetyltransferase [Sporosalibacterium faouarense]|uniref:GNAT family N-acetyltransferase n=1 Tax=Sporosalibacterium faouarense TaxID=516123 RepID=UPI00141D2235|nr:GNAT family N-acetyltransferase [Sporosalibacterium faouarense]MTI49595.1 GNAT family N-acetyltransferase [Bacillota bacterium]
MKKKIKIREITEKDTEWIINVSTTNWGSNIIISRGISHDVSKLPGFIALRDNEIVGMISYNIDSDNNCEIVLLESMVENQGIGTMLVDKVLKISKKTKVNKIWLITSNDNINALKFYQKKGFSLVAVHRDAITKARRIKPEIPEVGYHDIPIKDEIELEYLI